MSDEEEQLAIVEEARAQDMVTPDEVKATIKCLHGIWYDEDWLSSPAQALKLHRHMEVLFNYAGITSTLVKNNPQETSPEQFKEQFGVTEKGDGN